MTTTKSKRRLKSDVNKMVGTDAVVDQPNIQSERHSTRQSKASSKRNDHSNITKNNSRKNNNVFDINSYRATNNLENEINLFGDNKLNIWKNAKSQSLKINSDPIYKEALRHDDEDVCTPHKTHTTIAIDCDHCHGSTEFLLSDLYLKRMIICEGCGHARNFTKSEKTLLLSYFENFKN